MLKIPYGFHAFVINSMLFRIHEHSKTVEITQCFTSKPSCEHCIILHYSILHGSIGQTCVLENAFKTCIFSMICSQVSKIYKIKTSTNMYFFIYPKCSSEISTFGFEYANINHNRTSVIPNNNYFSSTCYRALCCRGGMRGAFK